MADSAPLSELCDLIVDCPHSTPVWTDSGVVVLRNQNIRNGRLSLDSPSFTDEEHYQHRTKRAVPTSGDLVITREAPMGEVCMIPDGLRCCLGQRMVLLRPSKSICDNGYLLYALQSRAVQHEIRVNEGTGSTVSNLRIPLLEKLPIPVRPLSEQKAIAEILGGLDAKIELNRRMNETLESLARALFKSWFVDFDPVRAKLDGRQPPNPPPATAALFPDSFEHQNGSLVPAGWTVEAVGDVVQSIGGATPSTKEPKFWEAGTHHWATPKDLSGLPSPILLSTDRQITDAGVAKISSGLLPAGTLLLSSRAPVGYLAIAQLPVAVNQGFIAMVCNERASNYFMLQWCRHNMDQIEGRASGTTFQEISKKNFRPIPMLVPPTELVAAFTDRAAPLYERMTINLRESETLAALRDTLLPRLLSGELRVADAERTILTEGSHV